MSYKIENEEMGFLNKVAGELEKLEKEIKFLDVNIYDIPKPTDRFPYTEDSEASDYPFSFSFKGRNFNVYPSVRKGFTLEVKEGDDPRSDITVKTVTFTMNEKTPTLKKVWKELLKELEEKFDLKETERYFFYQWCRRQRISDWKRPEEDSNCEAIYKLLTAEIPPEEIERLLEERYKKQENRIDCDVKNQIAKDLGVRFCTFLDGLRYFIITKNEVFCFKTKEEAYEMFERETFSRLKESLDKSFEEYKRIQKMIDEKEKSHI